LLLVEINAHTVATIVAMMGNATCTNGCCGIGTIATSFALLRRYVKLRPPSVAVRGGLPDRQFECRFPEL
jgi:hypothetical protein